MPSFDEICDICKIDNEVREIFEKCQSLQNQSVREVTPSVEDFDTSLPWAYRVDTYKHYPTCLSHSYRNVPGVNRFPELEGKFESYRQKVDEILDDEITEKDEQAKQTVRWTKLMQELENDLTKNYADEVNKLWIEEIKVAAQQLRALKLEDNQSDSGDKEARSEPLVQRIIAGIYWLLQMDLSINKYAKFLKL